MRFCPFWLLGSSRMKGTLRASRVNFSLGKSVDFTGFRGFNLPSPLKNIRVSWDYDSQFLWKNNNTVHGKIAKCSKPPTRIQSYSWCMLMYCKWGIYIYISYEETRDWRNGSHLSQLINWLKKFWGNWWTLDLRSETNGMSPVEWGKFMGISAMKDKEFTFKD